MADGPRLPTRSPLVERFVIGIDIQGFSVRSVRRQQLLQRDLDDLLGEAAAATGLDRREWVLQPTGDGELAIIPPDVDLALVVGRFVAELDGLLAARNDDCVEAMQLRLRLAMHIDALILSPTSNAGPALVVLTHLLDSAPVREALDAGPEARMAVIISEPVYRKVGLAGLGGVRPDQFTQVRVTRPDKGLETIAYVHVPGHDMRTFPTPSEDASDMLVDPGDPELRSGTRSDGSPAGTGSSSMYIFGPVHGDSFNGNKNTTYNFGEADDR